MGFIKKLLFNKDEFTKKDISFAKKGFIAENAINSSVTGFATGTYMVGLLTLLGATEAENSFILSLKNVAGLFMLLVPVITKNMVHKKPFALMCRFFDKFLLSILFLLPFIFGMGRHTVFIMGVVAFLSYIFSQLDHPVYTEWFMKCTQNEKQIGRFNSIRISALYVAMLVTSFTSARIIDAHTGENEIYGYMWLGIIAVILVLVQFGILAFIKEPYSEKVQTKKTEGTLESLKSMFKNKQIRPYLKFLFINQIGYVIATGGLSSILCVQRYGMSVSFIAYIGIGGYVLRILGTFLTGKLTDKIGGKVTCAIGYIIFAASCIFYVFMTAENVIIMRICVEVLFTIAWAFIDVATLPTQLAFIPEEKRGSYIACYTTLIMMLSTAVSWSVTAVVSLFNGFKVNLFGFEFSEMNLMFAVAFLTILTGAFMLLFAKQQKDN